MSKVAVTIIAFALVAFLYDWHSDHQPIAYHNDCLRSAIGNANRLELSLVPPLALSDVLIETKPAIIITDRQVIDRLLEHFILPWHLRKSGRFHECGGHLIINVTLPDSPSYTIRYDHGKHIYPIAKADDFPGICNLSEPTLSALNGYLLTLGYSEKDLGINRREK